ncbi:MAG: DAK2 domain-containing protein [Clostridiales bacterium]|nr:DAK2 domain-containing protein [Clostridiales bacterium]
MGDTNVISGSLFKKLMISGANNLHNNSQEVNDLNVFPIPDGDTGDNMYLTIKGGIDSLNSVEEGSISKMACALSQGMLLNARGNSGVILSQLFFGLSEGLNGKEYATLTQFADAMQEGVKRAYGAVAKPVEGTILTVARESVENVKNNVTDKTTVKEFFDSVLDEMKSSLQNTPELLETLKEAGVIDSGGAGLVYIIEGFCKTAYGEVVNDEVAVSEDVKTQSMDFSSFNENSVMEFGYCTELLLQLQTAKTNVDEFSIPDLIDYLNTLGDSIVAFKTGSVVKIHVHTLTPYKVLEHCQKFGEYLTVKIENMTIQHNETEPEKPKKESMLFEMNKKIKRPRHRFGVVTVASGEGLINVFKDLGADVVITGGQTNNPSAEDFTNAFDEVNADYIFVLPNNSNIILAANQAKEIYKGSDIRVIESKSLGEGYAALSMLDYTSDDPDAIEAQLSHDINDGVTGLVTKAVRTTSVNGVSITEGDYIGFIRGKMISSTTDKLKTSIELLKEIAVDKNFLIAVYGIDSTPSERSALAQMVAKTFPDLEFYEIDGGQEVYDFVFIVE